MSAATGHPRAIAPDALRAVAAGLVVLSHARVLIFRDAAEQPAMSAPGAAFFAVSGLGHQAVIVFFVLSGLLVTEAMLRLDATGRWSLRRFATARLVRLWIVLVPCLVLGGLLDHIGLALTGYRIHTSPCVAQFPSPLWRGAGGEGRNSLTRADLGPSSGRSVRPSPLALLHKGEGNEAALASCVNAVALTGEAQPYGIPPFGHPPMAPALGLDTMLGNLLFLQTVAVPVFGANGPLWSLANEAWYYALAGLGFAAWRMRRRPQRAMVPASAALLLLALLPEGIISLAPVWLCGAGVAWMRRVAWTLAPAMRWIVGCSGAVLSVAILLATRLHRGPEPLAADLTLGAAIAFLLLALPRHQGGGGSSLGSMLAQCGAAVSYSLYLSHVPVLSLFAAVVIGPRRLPLGAPAFLWLGLGLGLAGATASALWWTFERHTERVRAWIDAGGFRARTSLRGGAQKALP